MVTPPPSTPPVGLRYKFVWRLLIISNLALGAYLFATPRKKGMDNGDAIAKTASKVRSPPATYETTPVMNPEQLNVHPPIPENQQQNFLK